MSVTHSFGAAGWDRGEEIVSAQDLVAAKAALGEQLAACRRAAGFNQAALAQRVFKSRSTIANVEVGRQVPTRDFWQACDTVLGCDGRLISGFDELETLNQQHREQAADAAEVERGLRTRAAADAGRNRGGLRRVGAAEPQGISPAAPDTVLVRIQIEDGEVVMPFNRRTLLQYGIGGLAGAFGLDQQVGVLHDLVEQPRMEGIKICSSAQLEEIFVHLREQWHALVKTDNLLGPRFALAGVLNQITIVEALLAEVRRTSRLEAVRLGARYAESAAWLYEDSGSQRQARYWAARALEWAYEAGDKRMLAWTVFRRSQQAAAVPDAAQAIGLAQAARRDEEELAAPTRAAIRVQEACGYALDGQEHVAQRLLDEAHVWAANDTVGEARDGHGSYCTASFIELQRADCWLTSGKVKKAITLYEEGLRSLPAVYQRNRAAALSRLATAYVTVGQPEQAASTAQAALPVARSSGSNRILEQIKGVSADLAPHRSLHSVASLLNDLRSEDV